MPRNTKEYQRDYLRRYSKLPHVRKKRNARQLVYFAIKRGQLNRGRCEIEGCQTFGEAHHDDYDKPLEVRWLCKAHHEAHHHRNGVE